MRCTLRYRPGPSLARPSKGGLTAVDQLDLAVHEGEIFGLLGPNGAGKTTTVGMLTTRVIPTSGRAVVGGVDVVAHPSEAKQVIGVVSQQNTLDRSLNVWENLYYHGRYFGMGARASRQARRIFHSLRSMLVMSRAAVVLALFSYRTVTGTSVTSSPNFTQAVNNSQSNSKPRARKS